MTSSSDPAAPALRRLHPLSWLFVLLAQLRQFALPLIALLFFGRGGDWQLVAAGWATAALTALSVWRYFTFRYALDGDALVLRSGLLQRQVRHLPFARMHNLELRQNLLHRLFDVAELRIESATGDREAEAQMQVLSTADARDLVARIRGGRSAPDAAAARPALATVRLSELLWLGLSSNRGWIVVGALLGVAWQFEPEDGWRWLPNAVEWARESLRGAAPGLDGILAIGLLLLVASLLVRLLGVAVVVLRHAGFRVDEADGRITVEGGLLTRTSSHTRAAKVQRWQVREPWLLRRRGLRALHVETAARRQEDDTGGIDALLPVGAQSSVDRLLRRWLPGVRWEDADWQPIHPRAWRRMLRGPLFVLGLVTLVASLNLGAQGLLPLIVAPLLVLAVRRDAAFSGYSVDATRVLWRSGWLQRRWDVVERDRIQGLRLRQSPFDRRHGMAHLEVDTSGARGGATTLGYLPEAQARLLAAHLRRWLGQPRLLAPEHRGEQDQHREDLQAAEQHAERAEPDGGVADRAEGGGDLTQPRTEVGERGDGTAER